MVIKCSKLEEIKDNIVLGINQKSEERKKNR